MARRTPRIEQGALFRAAEDLRHVWRVEKFLTDDIHVALVRVDEPSRRKTLSLWALTHSRLFVPVAGRPQHAE
jgi:hypothetical protein